MTSHVSISRDGEITHIRLSRLDKLNAFSPDLVEGISLAVQRATTDGTRLLVFSGEGKGFSGGFDLDGLDTMTNGDLLLRFVRVEDMLQAVYHAPFATLALAHGPCYGAAADLFAACHYRIVAPGTQFRMPGPKFGVILGTRRLAALVGADAARRLLFRNGAFDHEEAIACGFAQETQSQEKWPTTITRVHDGVATLGIGMTAAIAERLTSDTRDADLAALVRSVSTGAIKSRIGAYIQDLRKKI